MRGAYSTSQGRNHRNRASIASKRCRKVVPVRNGEAITRGRQSGTAAISACSANTCARTARQVRASTRRRRIRCFPKKCSRGASEFNDVQRTSKAAFGGSGTAASPTVFRKTSCQSEAAFTQGPPVADCCAGAALPIDVAVNQTSQGTDGAKMFFSKVGFVEFERVLR